ncbi:ABC transporter permease [Evansella sp. AB-rgal1]|uniref:ABC transporter permease n=1 Tax=Evansella sp. AB-rgal1 TaxID=3242696 RepID=UPI00359D0DA8
MKSLYIGSAMLLLLFLMVIVSFIGLPHSPTEMNIPDRFAGPSAVHWLGTDQYGRDVLSRIILASQSAFIVSFGGVGTGMLIGCMLGATAAYVKGTVGQLIMRMMDGFFAFPNLLLAMIIVAALGSGIYNVLIAIAVFSIPAFSRLMYGFVLEAQGFGYIKAAHSYDAGARRIIFTHLIPAALPRIGVQMSMALGTGILTETALSFLGLGVQPPHPSWGGMLNEAQGFLAVAPLYPIIPGIVIFIAVVGFNLVGDGLAEKQKEATS